MSKPCFITYDLPTVWASYLVNGDASGLEESDIALCDRKTVGMGSCVSVSEESYFGRYNGQGCDLATYTFDTPRAPKDAMKRIITPVGLVGGGAPRGRADVGTVCAGLLYDRVVRLNKGGYDAGGAYWGTGKPLRVEFNGALTWVRFYRK